MAVLGRLVLGSAERLDLPDMLSIDSYTAADFKYLLQSFIGSDNPYILKGFEVIQPQDSIGTESVSIQIHDSVVYYPAAGAGSFYFGLEEGNVNAEPLVPELRKNSTNFVYLTFTTFDTARDNRAFWDPDQNGGEGGEFSQDINTESVLTVSINVSTSSFPENTIPVARVVVGPSVIDSIQDCRDMMFRLGSGGASPDPFSTYNFRQLPSASYTRNEPNTIMTSALDPNPFQGGDKNIRTLKEWMDTVMTLFKEVTGSTYWYESGAVIGSVPPNLKNVFLDTLGSTMKSKGEWQYSGTTVGEATWTEDIHIYSLIDPRNVVVRADTLSLPNDDTVAWIDLNRDLDINGSFAAVDWLNGSNKVDGAVGAFANVSKGDWIKKKADPDYLYLRVEEFYTTTDPGSGTTTPALAQSIKLSANYQGITGSDFGEYSKGEYTLADINVTDRDDPSIPLAGGNFFWLAYRSDSTNGLQSITPTQLSIDIEEADGTRAKITSVTHGLVDGDRIEITTGSYTGIYQVEVESDDIFYINTTTVAGDEFGESAFYAIVETRARETDDGFALETAEHGFETDQRVIISGSGTAYDGEYDINVRSATTFQIPYNTLTLDPGIVDGEIVRLSRLNVRTEFGTVKVVQGESIDIGDPDTSNILSYVGMPSLATDTPDYSTPPGYNTLFGQQNFNALSTDDLTDRASKLTSMMADRVQDRGIRILGRVNITNETNGADQDISATGSLTLIKPGSPDQTIDMTASMPANTALVAQVNRNVGNLIVPTVVSIGSPTLLSENNIILAYRFADTTVHLWEGTELEAFGHVNIGKAEDAQNKNIQLFVTGNVNFDPSNGRVTWSMARVQEETEIVAVDGASIIQSSHFLLSSVEGNTDYYAWFNVDGGGVDPAPAGRTAIPIAINSIDDADTVAAAIASAIDGVVDFSATATDDTIIVVNADPGETPDMDDVDTGLLITVLCQGVAPDPVIIMPGSANENFIDSDTINGLGTLLVPESYSAWVRVNRFAAKEFNGVETDATVEDTDTDGRIYVTSTDSVPVDQDVFVLYTNKDSNLVQHNKSERPDSNVYQETIDIVASLTPGDKEITGPVPVNTIVVLPLDSRDSDSAQAYMVGEGFLEVYLNGQLLLEDRDYEENGAAGCESNRIKLLQELVVGDELTFRIDTNAGVYFAGAGVSAGGGSLQDAYDNGRLITTQSGQPVIMSGPIGEKLLIIQGDLDVTGVIDPIGLEITQEATNPLSGRGIWVNNSDELIFERVSTSSVNLIEDFLYRDGSRAMLADLDMDGFNVINLPTPTLSSQATSKDYVDSNFFRTDGNTTATGDFNMDGNAISGLADPTSPQDAVTKAYSDSQDNLLLPLDGSRTMTGTLDLGSNLISNVLDPVGDQDAATKSYVDFNAGGPGNFKVFTNGDAATINAGDIVYAGTDPQEVLLALADDMNTVKSVIGVAKDTILPGNTGRIQLTGEATASVATLAPGEYVYVSDLTAGAATATAPTNIGSVTFFMGVATAIDKFVIIPSLRFENENTYEETLAVVNGAPADDNEITGPVSNGSTLTLPLDSRNLDNVRTYKVGSGDLELYLNGKKLEVNDDWSEIGALNTSSSTVTINIDLVVGDEIVFRDAARTTNITSGAGGGPTSLNDLTDVVITAPQDNDTIRYITANSRWENVPDALGTITGASNVGTGDGEVFKQISGGDTLELRNIADGDGIDVVQSGDDIQISIARTTTYFRDDVDNQPSQTILTSQDYVMFSNTLDVYRNGVYLMNSTFSSDNVGRYQETTRNSVQIDPGLDFSLAPVADDVFTLLNRDEEPDWRIIIAGKTGTVIDVPSYTVGNDTLQVFRNGVLLNAAGLGAAATQYTESSSTTITLGTSLVTDDVLVVIKLPTPVTARSDIDGETGIFISGVPTYTIGTDELLVYRNGVLMFNSGTLGSSFDRYSETSATSITLGATAVVGDVFTFIVK